MACERPESAQPLLLTLRRDPATRGWQADLESGAEPRHFESLAALLAWLAQLEALPPARGIR